MSTDMQERQDVDLRERAVLPIFIPLIAIVLTEIIVFSMSRVLLAVDKNAAVVIALGAALAILIGAAFVAARPRMGSSAIVGLLVVTGLVAIAAGAAALREGPHYLKEEAASRPTIDVSAEDLAFDTDELEMPPAGAVIKFTNSDSQPHNIAIYESEENLEQALFKGEIVSGGGSVTYEVGRLEPGEHYFHCDVHPTMKGTVAVAEGEAEQHT